MNPMQNKTPEERRAIAAKGHATRRARRDLDREAREARLRYADGLSKRIADLESKLHTGLRHETMNTASATLTGKSLLLASEIAAAAVPWDTVSGVYFLLNDDEVVYVGQSVHVHSRIKEHAVSGKQFNRYAFVPCPRDALDKLESLYIHCLRPRLNGDQSDGAKQAPIPLPVLIGATQ